MNNFNTLMQIYTALNMPVVDRLKKSWALVPKADKDIMKKVLLPSHSSPPPLLPPHFLPHSLLPQIGAVMHHSNNYRKYREALDAVEDEPCIPFHSLLLRDLTFIEEDPTFLEDSSINFEKLTLVSQSTPSLLSPFSSLLSLPQSLSAFKTSACSSTTLRRTLPFSSSSTTRSSSPRRSSIPSPRASTRRTVSPALTLAQASALLPLLSLWFPPRPHLFVGRHCRWRRRLQEAVRRAVG